MAEKSVDLLQMEEALRIVKEEKCKLEEESTAFIKAVQEENKQNHSKFTDELDDIFNSFRSAQKKYILDSMKKYSNDIEAVYKGWLKLDDEVAHQMGKEE